jgi:signal transduction histidine kinase
MYDALSTLRLVTRCVALPQIEQIIKEVIEDKEIEAKEALITLIYTEPPQLLPPLEADPVKLQYCLYELLTNALKYTAKNGSVVITSTTQKNTVMIHIADTGKGIPPERLPTLFDGFEKVDVMHTSQAGMGLGLHIVKKIIDLHRGTIAITSTEGSGTEVTITLPLKE